MSGNIHRPAKPGDPDYVSMDEHVRRQLAFNAEWEARPEVVAKRKADTECRARMLAEHNALRKRPNFIQSTDYPWLKPDWVEPPVCPFRDGRVVLDPDRAVAR
jgi:hypothetical protein